MSIRRQLLLVSLLTLLLPWAGCQYITELESALRDGQQSSLQDSTNAIASILQERRQLLYRYRSSFLAKENLIDDLYALPISVPITIDGFDDDWSLDDDEYRILNDSETSDGTLAVEFVLGADRNNIYLFLAVTDDIVVYRDDAQGPLHDAVRLVFWDQQENYKDLVFQTNAPGEIRATSFSPADSQNSNAQRVLGNWQPTASGYNLEIRIPQSMLGPRFGFAVIDGDAQPLDPLPYLGTIDPYDSNPFPALLNQPLPELAANVADLSQQGRRLRVLDRRGWILAQGGQLRDIGSAYTGTTNFVDSFYRKILDPGLQDYPNEANRSGKIMGPEIKSALAGQSSSIWYQPRGLSSAVISAAAPIYDGEHVAGVVTLEQTSAETLLLTNNALKRILSVTLMATALVVLGLLGFATLLSLRIRRLRNATEHAIADDGELHTSLPGVDARDELGDLSRSFESLLRQLNGYTQYLKSLASKLSHELRTPLAMVQSSLDNLQSQTLNEQSNVYAQRATAGVSRLRHIVSAMSAASRVEQSIETAEFATFDLSKVIKEMALGYQDTYPDKVIDAQTPGDSCMLYGVADLLAQMMDKLVENAVDFTPLGGAIQFDLEKTARNYILRVSNEGPPLPDHMKSRLFDSLISVRENHSPTHEEAHLGFGLFIARLVVTLHNGDIVADNLPNDAGVEFRITLPRKREPKA